MDFVRQASAATVLIALTLSFQSSGMVALIHWGTAHFARAVYPLGAVRSAPTNWSFWSTTSRIAIRTGAPNAGGTSQFGRSS